MNEALPKLLKIRQQKEEKQRQLCNDFNIQLEQKKNMYNHTRQEFETYKNQKPLIEKTMFEEIHGQNVPLYDIQCYQQELHNMQAFQDNLEMKCRVLIEEINSAQEELEKNREILIKLRQSSEKINLMIEQQTTAEQVDQNKKNDLIYDAEIDEFWSASEH